MSTMPSGTPGGQRRTMRVPYVIEVSAEGQHDIWTGFTENLSQGGVFIATPAEVPLGTRLTFELRMPTSVQVWVVRGEVRWIRQADAVSPGSPPGVGVQFVELDPGLESEIVAFLGTGRDAMFYDTEDAE